MTSPRRAAITAELAGFDRLLEVGIGTRTGVAAALADRGRTVVAIDVTDRSVPDAVTFRRADVTALASASDPLDVLDLPADTPIAGVDAVYACNLPAELQRPTRDLARRLDAACLFTTLGFEEPVVPVERRTVGDETLYVATDAL